MPARVFFNCTCIFWVAGIFLGHRVSWYRIINMKNFNFLSLEEHDKILIIKINREQHLNALNLELLKELNELMEFLNSLCFAENAYQKYQSVLLTGSGEKAFVAGADIKYMSTASREQIKEFIDLGQRLMLAIENLPLVVIAMVNGFAIGGGFELALACDFIFASDRAYLGLAELKLGLIPGFGGTQRLCSRVGISQAKKIIFTANNLSAQEAKELGIVDEVFEHSQLKEKSIEFIKLFSEKSPLAIASAKRAINKFFVGAKTPGLKTELAEFINLFQTEDAKEGIKAFIEKRKAQFQAR